MVDQVGQGRDALEARNPEDDLLCELEPKYGEATNPSCRAAINRTTDDRRERDRERVAPGAQLEPATAQVQLTRVQLGADRPQNRESPRHAQRLERAEPTGIRRQPSSFCGFSRIRHLNAHAMVTNVEPTVRVLIVDDHAVVRTGIRLLLDQEDGIEPVGEANSGREAIFEARS